MYKEKLEQIFNTLSDDYIDSLPIIHSPHEGYALVQDKIDTVMIYNKLAMETKDDLWEHITNADISTVNEDINKMYDYLLLSTYNMIKLAAMCKKFVEYTEEQKTYDRQGQD